MRALERSVLPTVLALALVVPAVAQGQECTARVVPTEVTAGSRAIPVRVTVSAPIGAVTGVDASLASGISLAFPDDLPPTKVAAIGGAPRTIEMGESENIWIVWLSVDEEGQGPHRVTFTAREGRCGARLVVRPTN